MTGIDCPFGWPQPFVTAVQAHADRRPWPGRHEPSNAFRAHLVLRETDREVRRRTGCAPLSVAADRIGLTALRCALLLDRLGEVDRTGVTGSVAEVYPAAGLRTWGLPWTGYKRGAARDRLPAMVAEMLRPTARPAVPDETRDEIEADDDAFDALERRSEAGARLTIACQNGGGGSSTPAPGSVPPASASAGVGFCVGRSSVKGR